MVSEWFGRWFWGWFGVVSSFFAVVWGTAWRVLERAPGGFTIEAAGAVGSVGLVGFPARRDKLLWG